MDHNDKIKCINKINSLKEISQLFGIIAFDVAPTIENIKPSSVITLNSRSNLLKYWLENCDLICNYFGIEYLLLREGKDSHTLFFYKDDMLRNHLKQEENIEYLHKHGYGDNLENQFDMLKENYKVKFPHEIGIFLGIPPLDVDGFIKNGGKNYLINGYWKVYTNLDHAIKIFQEFDKSRLKLMTQIDDTSILH